MNVVLHYLNRGSEYELINKEDGSRTLEKSDVYLNIWKKEFRHVLQNLDQSLTKMTEEIEVEVGQSIAGKEIAKIQMMLNDETLFTSNAVNLALYPHLWSNTSRYRATTISTSAEEEENRGEASLAAYDRIDRFLNHLKFDHPWYKTNKIDRMIRKKIQAAQVQLRAVRKDQKRKFLYQIKTHTAEIILQQIAMVEKPQPAAPEEQAEVVPLAGPQEPLEPALLVGPSEQAEAGPLLPPQKQGESSISIRLIESLQRLRDLQSVDEAVEDDKNSLKTREQVLEEHYRTVQLEKELLTFVEAKVKDKNTADLMRDYISQLAIVTKRWLDPHYKQPLYLTPWEKFRVFLRGSTAFLGVIGALGIIASLIFFPPLVPIFTAISFSGFYGGIIDNTYEVAKNLLRYKRSPLRIQVRELEVFSMLVATLLGGIPGVIAGLGLLASRGGPIVNGIINGMKGFSHFGTNSIFTLVNLRGVILQGKLVQQQKHVRSQSQLKRHPVVSAEVGKQFICKSQTARGIKPSATMLTPASPIVEIPPQEAGGNHGIKPVYYLYAGVAADDAKGKQPEIVESLPPVDKFFATQSQSGAILGWHTGPWRSSYAKEVVKAVAEFHRVEANASINTRQKALNHIQEKIVQWERSHPNKEQESRRWPNMMALKKYVENEQAILSQLPRAEGVEKKKRPILVHM